MATKGGRVTDRFAKQFGERVRLARLESGLTQAQLAEAAQVGPNYVPRIERGEMTPSVDAAFRLARALGVSVDDLCAPPPRRDPVKDAMRALAVLSEHDLASFRKSLHAIEAARSSLRKGDGRARAAAPEAGRSGPANGVRGAPRGRRAGA
jgi:putative transcriptional regulator